DHQQQGVDPEDPQADERPGRASLLGRGRLPFHEKILSGGVTHGKLGLLQGHERWLARRRERSGRRCSKGRAQRLSGKGAESFAPEEAVVAGDLGTFLHIVEVAPLRPVRILFSTSRVGKGVPNETAAICGCCQFRRKTCRISISADVLPALATPVENYSH